MKKIIALSLVAATAMAFGSTESDLAALKAEIDALKKEVAALKAGGGDAKVGKEITKLKKGLSEVKSMAANDNIKWSVDFRTAVDGLNYKMASGATKSNDSLMSTRLWLNMAYAPDTHNIFKGQLSYNKAFGADFGGNGTGAMPRGWGMDTFDWVTNESLTDNGLKVRQAYWLYMGDTAFGADMPWTLSLGRRPSTNGFLVNLRDDDKFQSPLGHIINVEFDGASAGINLGKVTGIPGMHFKLCLGQGSTNANPMFASSTSYTDDENSIDDIRLAGFIFTPFDNGQYIVKTTAFKSWDLPGYDASQMGLLLDADPTTNPSVMSQAGDMYGAAISVLVNGFADFGYLSDVKVFGSVAMSRTAPKAGEYMLGMPTPGGTVGADAGEAKTGYSYWFGVNLPVFEKGTLGVEYNHGSKYWRPFDYGEDTMVGSKLAARGDAWEAYYTHQITDALSAQLRYTYIDYDYTGSNNFFGADGVPLTMEQAVAFGMGDMVVDKAQDIRFYVRYKF